MNEKYATGIQTNIFRVNPAPFGVVEKVPVERRDFRLLPVIPAKAGIHFYAFCLSSGFPRISGGMKRRRVFTRIRKWIPAFAGMTNKTAPPHPE